MFKKKPAYIKYSKRKMPLKKKRRYLLIGISCAVIIIALLGTFFLVRYSNRPRSTYAEMGEASIPSITCYYKDRLINRMYGYTMPMDEHYMRDTLYILQDTYSFDIHIDDPGEDVLSLSYRLTELKSNNLIQNSDATYTFQREGDALRATLQIENMIDQDREYSLELILSMRPGKNVHYYTRIMKSSAPYLDDHFKLIEDLHKSTFDYDACEKAFGPYKSEGDYLYDDTVSFGRITLYSTISWLSWDEMNVKETIAPTINIVDYDGELAFFRTDYQAGRELETTAPQYYNVSEYFRTRINENSTFLLDYERLTDEIYFPTGEWVSSDHLNLGILSNEDIHSMCSPDGNQTAFVVNKALWLMNSRTKEMTSVFNFVSDHADVRDVFDQHDIKIVNVTNDGDIRFLVYGYMNKGIHEGKSGIGLYTFKFSELKVTEDAFIPSDVPYQLLKYSIGNLCYMNSNDTLYIMINGDVYSIDPETNAAVLEIENLSEDSCKVSEDNSKIAWHAEKKVNDATSIRVLNMETLQSYTITAEEGKHIKALGFLSNDLIYGEGESQMYTDANDNDYLLMSHIYAAGADGEVQNENSEPGFYFIKAEQEYNRLIFDRVFQADGDYKEAESFTLFATDLSDYPNTTTYNAMEETRGSVILLGLPVSNVASVPLNIIVSTSTIFSSEEVTNVRKMIDPNWNYLVYAKGRLISPETDPAEAVTKAYDNTGCVVNTDGSYFYRRGMRAAFAEIPEDQIEDAIAAYRNGKCLNISGIGLAQAMSFTARRIPLIWEQDDAVYVISGYTTSDALILNNIERDEITYAGYNQTDRIFSTTGKLFVYQN